MFMNVFGFYGHMQLTKSTLKALLSHPQPHPPKDSLMATPGVLPLVNTISTGVLKMVAGVGVLVVLVLVVVGR